MKALVLMASLSPLWADLPSTSMLVAMCRFVEGSTVSIDDAIEVTDWIIENTNQNDEELRAAACECIQPGGQVPEGKQACR